MTVPTAVPTAVPTTVVLSYGLGVDSTAILLRWLTMTTAERGFDLDDLIVVTAQVGSEYPETIRLVEAHVYPLLRAAGIRTVELAKAGPTVAHGVKVLQDSREPVALHPDGAYRLVDESRESATIPQYGGIRKCSLKFKGEPIDRWLHENLPPGPFVHVMGFEKEEGPWLGEGPAPKNWSKPGRSRAERDAADGAKNKKLGHHRQPSYPLVEWGWDRARCLDYIKSVTGEDWAKSACTFCPFAEDRGIGRLSCGAAVETMKLEVVAAAINPRQTLFTEVKGIRGKHKGRPMPGSAMETYELHFPEAYAAFIDDVASGEWTCYEVRRVWHGVGAPTEAKNGKPGKPGKAGSGGDNDRQLRVLVTGTEAECLAELGARAEVLGLEVTTDRFGITRMIDLAPKPDFGSGVEHRITVAPAGALDKEPKSFRNAEARVLSQG